MTPRPPEVLGEMRLLLLAGEFPPFKGGIAQVASNLTRVLGDRGHRVTVVTPFMKGGNGQPFRGHVDIRRFPFCRVRGIRMLPTLPYVLRHAATKPVDVCVADRCTRTGVLAYMNRRVNGTPYVTFAYGTEFLRYAPGSLGDRWVCRIIRDSEGVIAISSFTRSALVERGVSEAKITVMSPGLNLPVPSAVLPAEAARRRLGLAGDPVLLSVSRLVPHKGHDTVLRSLPPLVRRWPELRYVIVGRGRHEADLRRLAAQLGVAQHVHFAGFVDDDELSVYCSACDLFVMPSREEQGSVEGFGISFLEAAAHGRPAIGGRGTGAEDAIADGVTGILVDPYSAEAVTEGIAKLLGDEPLRKQMGVAARARVESDFSWERAVATVERVLMEAATVGRP